MLEKGCSKFKEVVDTSSWFTSDFKTVSSSLVVVDLLQTMNITWDDPFEHLNNIDKLSLIIRTYRVNVLPIMFIFAL